MIRGTVVGEVWATRRAPGLAGRKLLLVAVEGADQVVVAQDALDAGRGDTVLVSWGSGARNALQPGPGNRELLCDAATAVVVDGSTGPEEPGCGEGGGS